MRSNPSHAMSGQVCVLQIDPARDGVEERPAAGPSHGFRALEQSVLWLESGGATVRATGGAEEVLFIAGGDGRLRLHGDDHTLETETGVYLDAGEKYAVTAGTDGIRMVRVRIPDPDPAPAAGGPRTIVSRLADQDAQDATTDRWFRIVADPSTGLRSATHFVGYIPAIRAPEHFHAYDEVIYVLEGQGRFDAEGATRPVAPGTCIGLPARVVHCLENTGPDVMRVVAVFRPAGSPAAAYYPDGTPAFEAVEAAATDLK